MSALPSNKIELQGLSRPQKCHDLQSWASSADKNSTHLSFGEYYYFKNEAEKVSVVHRVKSTATGSFFSDAGLILTVAHAVEPSERAKIVYNGRIIKASVIYRDNESDIMILSIDPNEVESIYSLNFGESNSRLGEKIFGLGYPHADFLNFEPVFCSMNVTSTAIEDMPDCFHHDGQHLERGMSGMCLVNDRCQIVGMSKMIRKLESSGENLMQCNIAVYAESLRKVLKKYTPSIFSQRKLSQPEIAERLLASSVTVLACER
jgi:S1-C subfamily serine protease